MFNFGPMLEKYEQTITILSNDTGSWVDGIWVPGAETETDAQAAVFRLTKEALDPRQGGRYTIEDKKIYIHQVLSKGQSVKIDNLTYLIDRRLDYTHHASGLNMYIVVRKGESA